MIGFFLVWHCLKSITHLLLSFQDGIYGYNHKQRNSHWSKPEKKCWGWVRGTPNKKKNVGSRNIPNSKMESQFFKQLPNRFTFTFINFLEAMPV